MKVDIKEKGKRQKEKAKSKKQKAKKGKAIIAGLCNSVGGRP
jgi:hypothetical protein